MGKITVTFSNGRCRVLKPTSDLSKIDKNRKVMFIMGTFEVYEGYSDGEVDDEGNIGLFGTTYRLVFPVSKMIGWCYVNAKK